MSVERATATERLALSRESLRGAMRGGSGGISRTANASSTAPQPGALGAWFESLKTLPGATIAIEALSGWWAQHPLRLSGAVAADVAVALARPLAQRHPVGLVVSALLLGGLIAWSRPWRWIVRPALFAGLLPQVLSKTLAHLPAQSWLTVLSSLTQAPRHQPGPMAPLPPQPVPPTHPDQASATRSQNA